MEVITVDQMPYASAGPVTGALSFFVILNGAPEQSLLYQNLERSVRDELWYKILRVPGKQYADIEIEIGPDRSLRELQARTIHPDGTIIDFKDKVLIRWLY